MLNVKVIGSMNEMDFRGFSLLRIVENHNRVRFRLVMGKTWCCLVLIVQFHGLNCQ